MEVTVAKSAGFCFGVKRAIDTVYQEIEKGEQVFTLGPIIHNEQVVQELADKGVRVIHSLEELADIKEGTVVIRSHGVSEKVIRQLEKYDIKIVDATCPFVSKIHRIVQQKYREGYRIVIIGSRTHPEVEGINGWCEDSAAVLETVDEAENFRPDPQKKLCIVSQTTFNYKKFKDMVAIFEKKSYDILVMNTICNATEERQTEAGTIARQSDAMLVIGGKHSSNTQKLYEICSKECPNTYFIQTLDDLNLELFQSFRSVGITAGASTQIILLRRFKLMSDMNNDFEQMLEASLVTIHNGEIVEGTVIDVKEDEIVLNIGYKADGIITRNEYSNQSGIDLRDVVKVDDVMKAKVLKVNDGEGQVLLTYKRLAMEKSNERIREAFENKEVLKATVTAVLSGGLSVVVDETKIFIPASLVSDSYEKDLSKYNGQEIEFVVTEFNPKKRRIIGDRKQLLVAEKAKLKEELFARIHVGDVVEGTVKNLTDFGAFIDLGGADGLLHISEMSWGRVENPRKVFKVGDVTKVLIKDIKDDKIALSLKFEDQNPWLNADGKYNVGAIVKGRVARMADFGAFVELEPGVDALLHVSQISKEHVDKPSDVLSVGQEIEAKVVDFNNEDHKISLSMKALLNDNASEEEEVAVDTDAE